MALVCAVLLYQFWLFGLVVWYKYQNPGASAVMREEYARLSEGHADFRLQHEWVPYDKISNSLKRAVVAAEDSNFTEHDGVEWEAIRKAWEYNQKQEEAGRSNARRLHHHPAVGQEPVPVEFAQLCAQGSGTGLTLHDRTRHEQERILELYLNVAEWGVGVFGAEAAAKHYFNTSAAGLGASQSARLAAMLPNPRYDRSRSSNYLNSRVGVLTRRMQMVDIP